MVLIKITNYCSMGCSHCMEDSTVAGAHMSLETFQKALTLTARLEQRAYQAGAPRLVLLSGGECSEHPDFESYVDLTIERGFFPVLITNGLWLADERMRANVLRPNRVISVQVTNDSRFYPRMVDLEGAANDSRVTFVPSLTGLMPLGRAAGKPKLYQLGVPAKQYPASFNFRSLTRQYRCVETAIAGLRLRALKALSGHCTPSISSDGTIVAGETNNCFVVGDVDSTSEEITKAVIEMQCNRCGLVDNLPQDHKRAIGESVLYSG